MDPAPNGDMAKVSLFVMLLMVMNEFCCCNKPTAAAAAIDTAFGPSCIWAQTSLLLLELIFVYRVFDMYHAVFY